MFMHDTTDQPAVGSPLTSPFGFGGSEDPTTPLAPPVTSPFDAVDSAAPAGPPSFVSPLVDDPSGDDDGEGDDDENLGAANTHEDDTAVITGPRPLRADDY